MPYTSIIACLILFVLSPIYRAQAIDLSQLEDAKIPLFDSNNGERWGHIYFKNISIESSTAGPFEVDALRSARLSHLSLRFTYWPDQTDLSICLRPLVKWGGGDLPENIPSLRLECEGRWALMLKNISILAHSTTPATSSGARLSFRASKVIYVQPGKAEEFTNTHLIYCEKSHSIILASPQNEAFHIPLPNHSN